MCNIFSDWNLITSRRGSRHGQWFKQVETWSAPTSPAPSVHNQRSYPPAHCQYHLSLSCGLWACAYEWSVHRLRSLAIEQRLYPRHCSVRANCWFYLPNTIMTIIDIGPWLASTELVSHTWSMAHAGSAEPCGFPSWPIDDWLRSLSRVILLVKSQFSNLIGGWWLTLAKMPPAIGACFACGLSEYSRAIGGRTVILVAHVSWMVKSQCSNVRMIRSATVSESNKVKRLCYLPCYWYYFVFSMSYNLR